MKQCPYCEAKENRLKTIDEGIRCGICGKLWPNENGPVRKVDWEGSMPVVKEEPPLQQERDRIEEAIGRQAHPTSLFSQDCNQIGCVLSICPGDKWIKGGGFAIPVPEGARYLALLDSGDWAFYDAEGEKL